MTQLILILTLAMFFTACDNSGEGEPIAEPLAYEVVTTSNQLRVDEPHTQVFRTWEEWSAFWSAHPECSEGCVFEVPYVDFESEMVAAVFWGLEEYGCVNYQERLESLTRLEDRTTIVLQSEQSQSVCPAMTYAYLFLKFERADVATQFSGAVPQ